MTRAFNVCFDFYGPFQGTLMERCYRLVTKKLIPLHSFDVTSSVPSTPSWSMIWASVCGRFVATF